MRRTYVGFWAHVGLASRIACRVVSVCVADRASAAGGERRESDVRADWEVQRPTAARGLRRLPGITSRRWTSHLGPRHDATRSRSSGTCSRYPLIDGTRRRQLSIDICCPRPSSAANPPHIVPNRLTCVHPCVPVIPLVPSDSSTLISSLFHLSAHYLALAAVASQPLKSGTLSLHLSVPVPVLTPFVVTSRPSAASRPSTPLYYYLLLRAFI